jgi:hypothetical protein
MDGKKHLPFKIPNLPPSLTNSTYNDLRLFDNTFLKDIVQPKKKGVKRGIY